MIDRRGAPSAAVVIVSKGPPAMVADGLIGDDHDHHMPPAMTRKPARPTATSCRRGKEVRVAGKASLTSGFGSAATAAAEALYCSSLSSLSLANGINPIEKL